jgi:hypothetical protein
LNLEDVHLAQAKNYLVAYDLEIGLLINFRFNKSLQSKDYPIKSSNKKSKTVRLRIFTDSKINMIKIKWHPKNQMNHSSDNLDKITDSDNKSRQSQSHDAKFRR